MDNGFQGKQKGVKLLAETALLKAIGYCGKQKRLADLIGETPDKISYWLNRGKRIPFHSAAAIEKATQGYVSRYDLAPYARITRKIKNEYELLEINRLQMSISQRVAMALSIEQSLGNAKGTRSASISAKKSVNMNVAALKLKEKSQH